MAHVSVTVSVQANARDRSSWLALIAEVETAGFETLYVGDHPGTEAAPFVALAAAASVSERTRLGTCVVNAGVWDPVALASAVRTLDVLSGGRAVLGVGAGHTPHEWIATGRPYPSPGARVDRMIELVEITEALLHGERVSRAGRHFTVADAALTEPRPVQDPVPLMVGGSGIRLLRFAALHADIVGISGLGRTLDDGHRHEVDWSRRGVERIAELIQSVAEPAGRRPQLEALVQHVEITDDAEAVATQLTAHIPGASVHDLLNAPFVWIGTAEEIQTNLRDHHSRLGLERYVVRAAAIPQVVDVFS